MKTKFSHLAPMLAPIAGALAALLIVGILSTVWHPQPAQAGSQFATILCDTYKPISIASNTQVLTAANANMFFYVCSYNLAAGVADNFSIVEGTGSTCGTGTLAMVGSTTAANGIQFTATTGGNVNFGGGAGAVTKTAVAGDNVCILVSSAGPLAGVIGYTTAPF